jgi:hypothetical protein
MRALVALGMASLALGLATSSANAKGAEAYGSKTNAGDVTVTCRTLVNAKYCAGKQCAPGAAEATARSHMGACIQNGGKL